ncbi:Aste57867_23752 [Aphanomyces stellatus]|uniref:Aste57867_23752 protein n=1 Tax=Aphanomyces stellatus TaxID=120398 RepID=A0A485LQE4_9STRA|nr:hypothetical protein As57867_023680 [Aphanomyces stellatus]VFU00397.1 Aste57867_23752 [Aphanomyces stellatus]
MSLTILSVYVTALPIVIATIQTVMDWITEQSWKDVVNASDVDALHSFSPSVMARPPMDMIERDMLFKGDLDMLLPLPHATPATFGCALVRRRSALPNMIA